MSLRVARDTILQEEFDSGSLTPLCTVIHFIEEPGLYIGQATHDKEVVATFRVQAVGDGAARQINIDLATLRGMQTDAELLLAPGGIVFYSSYGAIGYSVKLWRADGGRRKLEFDSRKLGADDLFTVTLLQPGGYEVADERDSTLSRLSVGQAKVGKKPYRPPAPAIAGLSAETLADSGTQAASLSPAQTQVFRAEGRSRIVVRLTDPAADGAADPAPDKITWRRAEE